MAPSASCSALATAMPRARRSTAREASYLHRPGGTVGAHIVSSAWHFRGGATSTARHVRIMHAASQREAPRHGVGPTPAGRAARTACASCLTAAPGRPAAQGWPHRPGLQGQDRSKHFKTNRSGSKQIRADRRGDGQRRRRCWTPAPAAGAHAECFHALRCRQAVLGAAAPCGHLSASNRLTQQAEGEVCGFADGAGHAREEQADGPGHHLRRCHLVGGGGGARNGERERGSG